MRQVTLTAILRGGETATGKTSKRGRCTPSPPRIRCYCTTTLEVGRHLFWRGLRQMNGSVAHVPQSAFSGEKAAALA